MELVRYSQANKQECLDIFRSNTPKYFAAWELGKFTEFLEKYAATESFYVLLAGSTITGCGGYEMNGSAVELTWGMIHRSLHKKGYGSFLLALRLEEIRKQFGEVTVLIETTQVAEGFFAKHGFVATSRVKDGFTPGLDKVAMIRTA